MNKIGKTAHEGLLSRWKFDIITQKSAQMQKKQEEKMKTYLVTGGAGFIGSNYIHYMFKKYGDTIRIINVDCLTYAGNLENLKDIEDKENYTFIKADICDARDDRSRSSRRTI